MADESQAEEYIASAVAGQRDVLVINAGIRPAGGWFADAMGRLRAHPTAAGVMHQGTSWLFGFPAGVTRVDAPQTTWPLLKGLGRRTQPGTPHQDVTAVIIAKDEVDVIAECVTSALPFVDEVLVYDTGSSDGTQASAKGAGARVEQGHWDGDFAAARNRALRFATTDWVLILDADEIVTGDPHRLRALLDGSGADILTGPQISGRWRGARSGDQMNHPRFHRRSQMHYVGAIHETLQPIVPGEHHSSIDAGDVIQFLHSGFTEETMARKDKGRRNLEAAMRDLDDAAPGTGAAIAVKGHIARSLHLAGRRDEARAVFEEMLADPTASPGTIVMAGRVAAREYLGRAEVEPAERWVRALELAGESRSAVSELSARVFLLQGRPDDALHLLRRVVVEEADDTDHDPWGVAPGIAGPACLLVELELTLGHGDAARKVLERLIEEEPTRVPVTLVVKAYDNDAVTLSERVSAFPRTFIDTSLRQVVASPTREGLIWLEALHASAPTDAGSVLAASALAPALPWQEALKWTERAYVLGLQVSPVAVLAEAGTAPVIDRCLAYAALFEMTGEEIHLITLLALLEDASSSERETVVDRASVVAPAAVAAMASAVSSPPLARA